MHAIERQNNLTLLRLLFMKKGRDLSNYIVARIDSKADDMQSQLMHDIEWCGDPKGFYEKEIPYRLENQLRKDMQQITEMIAQQYTSNLTWLQGNLKRIGCRNFSVPLTDYNMISSDHNQEKLNLIDIHKTRLYSRLGTLFVALCLSGFGLGAFVGSMLCGTGAEELLISKSKNSKDTIKRIVPGIVDNYKLQLKANFLGALAEVDSNIMNELNNIQL